MPIADPTDLTFTRFEFPDIPFPTWISRQGLTGDDAKCLVARNAPHDRREQLVDGIARALEDKANQLGAYRMPAVLLLDFDDISLLSDYVVAEAFAKAAEMRQRDAAAISEIYLEKRVGRNERTA